MDKLYRYYRFVWHKGDRAACAFFFLIERCSLNLKVGSLAATSSISGLTQLQFFDWVNGYKRHNSFTQNTERSTLIAIPMPRVCG